MRTPFARLAATIAVVGSMLVTGCFGGGDLATATATGTAGGATSTPTTATSTAKDSLVLLTENWQLASGDSSSVRITAVLKDAANVLKPNEPVSFSASSGSLQVVQKTTDALGNAVAILTTANEPVPRTISVKASTASSATPASLDIEVTGTQLRMSGPTSAIGVSAPASIGLKLVAGDGSALGNQVVSLSSREGNSLSATTVVTDKQGEATITVTALSRNDDRIVAKALGGAVTGEFNLAVSADGLMFIAPTGPTEVPLGASQNVSVQLLSNGAPLANQSIDFSITRGYFDNAPGTTTKSVVTNALGVASVSVKSTNAGGAILTASTSQKTASLALEFYATTPANMILEAAPRIVSMGAKSTITATVRDANQNLVKRQKVRFNLVDITNGTLSLGEVETNSLGQASTVYTAGVQASGENGVSISANAGSSVTASTTLTVDPQIVRLTFGTGNEIFEPNPAQYRKPYVVQVNNNGVPVTNANVQISVYPVRYFKGYFVPVVTRSTGSSTSEAQPDAWGPYYTIDTTADLCQSEDTNHNGRLDAGEQDLNGDGTLTPPAVVTIAADTQQTPTVSKATVTTDSNGFGYFNLTYPQDQAYWLEVELVAQTTLAG